MNRNCSVCKKKIDENNCLKDRTFRKSCYNENKRRNNINTLIQNQHPKTDNINEDDKKKKKFVDSVKNRTLTIEVSNCGKTYLMNHILYQKQEPIFIITKSLNHYLNINAQTSDEIEPLENFENTSLVFDDMLLSKQESNIDRLFTRGRHQNIDIYYISQSYFHLPKHTIRNNSNKVIFFEQTLKDIIIIFHYIAGLDMNLMELEKLCRKAWKKDNDFLQIDRFAKIGEGRYTIRNCNKNSYFESTPETKHFQFLYINMIYSVTKKDELGDSED